MKSELENAKNLKCEKCFNETFSQVFVIKQVSGLLVANGKDTIVPIPIFACNNCKHINDLFVKELKINLDNKTEPLMHVQV